MSVVPYETRLPGKLTEAMREASRHFEGDSYPFRTMRRIAVLLDRHSIPYVVLGGMAVFAHGYRRTTTDVDILVQPSDLDAIHATLDGEHFIPTTTGSRHRRDCTTGVRLRLLLAVQFPGDGKPKPVAFPDPADVAVEIKGVRYVSLPTLVDLKLASGMTGGVSRLKDLADVVALIQTLHLPQTFGEQLSPYTRPKFDELWTGLRDSPQVDE